MEKEAKTVNLNDNETNCNCISIILINYFSKLSSIIFKDIFIIPIGNFNIFLIFDLIIIIMPFFLFYMAFVWFKLKNGKETHNNSLMVKGNSQNILF